MSAGDGVGSRRAWSRRKQLFWSVYGACYDRLWDTALTDAIAQAVVRHVPRDRPVVEIGAGTGLVTEALVDLRVPVRAVEPSPAMAKRLRRRLGGRPAELDTTADWVDLARRPHGADDVTVVAVNVVHLTPDPSASIEALRRIAGPRGTAVVVAPAPGVGVARVAAAMRARGEARRQVGAFAAAHLVLGPLAALAGAAPRPVDLRSADGSDAEVVEVVAGVAVLVVYRGLEQTAGGAVEADRPRDRVATPASSGSPCRR